MSIDIYSILTTKNHNKHYLDQGWNPRQTKEHKSKFIIAFNKKRMKLY